MAHLQSRYSNRQQELALDSTREWAEWKVSDYYLYSVSRKQKRPSDLQTIAPIIFFHATLINPTYRGDWPPDSGWT